MPGERNISKEMVDFLEKAEQMENKQREVVFCDADLTLGFATSELVTSDNYHYINPSSKATDTLNPIIIQNLQERGIKKIFMLSSMNAKNYDERAAMAKKLEDFGIEVVGFMAYGDMFKGIEEDVKKVIAAMIDLNITLSRRSTQEEFADALQKLKEKFPEGNNKALQILQSIDLSGLDCFKEISSLCPGASYQEYMASTEEKKKQKREESDSLFSFFTLVCDIVQIKLPGQEGTIKVEDKTLYLMVLLSMSGSKIQNLIFYDDNRELVSSMAGDLDNAGLVACVEGVWVRSYGLVHTMLERKLENVSTKDQFEFFRKIYEKLGGKKFEFIFEFKRLKELELYVKHRPDSCLAQAYELTLKFYDEDEKERDKLLDDTKFYKTDLLKDIETWKRQELYRFESITKEDSVNLLQGYNYAETPIEKMEELCDSDELKVINFLNKSLVSESQKILLHNFIQVYNKMYEKYNLDLKEGSFVETSLKSNNERQKIILVKKRQQEEPFSLTALAYKLAQEITAEENRRINPILNEKDNKTIEEKIFIKMNPLLSNFKQIHQALIAGNTSMFKMNFMKKRNSYNNEALFNEILSRAAKRPNGTTAKAWELACKYANKSNENLEENHELFKEIYKYSYDKSRVLFFKRTAYKEGIDNVTMEEIKEQKIKNTQSRTAKIMEALKPNPSP